MKVKPVLDKVVAEVMKSESATKSGILLARSNSKDEPIMARVIARGDGGMTDEGRKLKMYVNEGDIIMIPKNGGTKFDMDGKEYVIISQEDILATVYPN